MEVDSLRSENDSLKAAESEVVMTMRHNAQVASEYLNKTASHAHSSIRQVSMNRCVCLCVGVCVAVEGGEPVLQEDHQGAAEET